MTKKRVKIGDVAVVNMAYTFEEARKQINFYKRTGGPYWNNIVASILAQVAEESGKETANRLIEVCKLERLGWHKEPL